MSTRIGTTQALSTALNGYRMYERGVAASPSSVPQTLLMGAPEWGTCGTPSPLHAGKVGYGAHLCRVPWIPLPGLALQVAEARGRIAVVSELAVVSAVIPCRAAPKQRRRYWHGTTRAGRAQVLRGKCLHRGGFCADPSSLIRADTVEAVPRPNLRRAVQRAPGRMPRPSSSRSSDKHSNLAPATAARCRRSAAVVAPVPLSACLRAIGRVHSFGVAAARAPAVVSWA
jgi:hypothetical protein